MLNLIDKKNVGAETVELLNKVEVPSKFYKRIDLGIPVLNEIFGGKEMPGILPGSVHLFTAAPGAGKSTMSLQLSELIHNNAGRSVLYNCGEESKAMVKLRANRLGLKGDFCVSNFETLEELRTYCKRTGVEVCVQDSLQTLKFAGLDGVALTKAIGAEAVKWAKEDDITLILIGHITKGGQFAGPQMLKHIVDVHSHMSFNKDTGGRILEMHKNRFGPAQIPYEFPMSSAGFDFSRVSEPDPAAAEVGGAGKAAQRRETTCEFIKEQLLKGEKVSGYCFERFNIDVSGGFWRGMVARAVKELEANNHKIVEKRIDGRIHMALEI